VNNLNEASLFAGLTVYIHAGCVGHDCDMCNWPAIPPMCPGYTKARLSSHSGGSLALLVKKCHIGYRASLNASHYSAR
jgi:hypothetical protein